MHFDGFAYTSRTKMFFNMSRTQSNVDVEYHLHAGALNFGFNNFETQR